MYTSIRPGQKWLDTDGNPIQAHGAKLYYEHGVYYWIGENKEKTDGINGIWTYGIRCYSSRDLYNWKDEGLIISPNEKDPSSPLYIENMVDRPHLIYNSKTKKYVCWIKISGKASYFVLTSDSILGPYEIVCDELRPLGGKGGDFDLVKDEETGKAYLFFDHNRKEIAAVELTDDYLNVKEEQFTSQFEGRTPPFTREGPAHVKHGDKHFLITSCRTGYMPNPSEYAVADDWLGPYVLKGNPHVEDASSASFNSQISGIFKHPEKKNLYIVLADRWVPNYTVTKERFESCAKAIGSRYDQSITVTDEQEQIFKGSPCGKQKTIATRDANYVWLPAHISGDTIEIRWLDEWRIEDFE